MKELPEAKPGRSDVPAAPSELSGDPITHVDGEGGSNQGWDHPNRFTILKIAPTFFFADYGCHVRILEKFEFSNPWGTGRCLPIHQDRMLRASTSAVQITDPGTQTLNRSGAAKAVSRPLLFIKASRVASQIKPNGSTLTFTMAP